ncbi:tyrosine-protein kinase receptor Tie-1 [Caerostris extrusa]|uniref:Tyrosine-protein kinase receptor Tie-1 n=1 Tax=Caerostris extrusa TaxID=172846 RepID=A0AAV4S371_CAEEX|nr:tyrosine-protein kinase receptor Tie-1 [Caerostris extrusa]
MYVFISALLFICIKGGFCISGPDLIVSNITESKVHVVWTPVRVPGKVVSAYPLKSYSNDLLKRNEWTFSNTSKRTDLVGLHPGTMYNISVWAVTSDGHTDPTTKIVWTEVGDPVEPSSVEILEKNGKTMVVHLPVGVSDKGPITNYYVIPVQRSNIILFNPEDLSNYSMSLETGLPYYITANLTPEQANKSFTIGDGQTYNGYYNAPLSEDKDYDVVVGIVSSLNEVTKISYSPLQSTLDAGIPGISKAQTSSTLSVILSAAIGEENGFVPGMLQLSDDADLSEFGEVREGVVQRRSQSIPCIVQHMQALSLLADKEKRTLLCELDLMSRVGFHANVVEFLGACDDERDILQVAVEHHHSSLRGLLLRSRQPPGGKVSSLSEPLLLELASGIAQGMAHLADRGILHKHLSARNILIADGSIPKVAHFGLGYYNPLGKKLLYSRWTAPEVSNLNTFTSKSDVWAFGVAFLWELLPWVVLRMLVFLLEISYLV